MVWKPVVTAAAAALAVAAGVTGAAQQLPEVNKVATSVPAYSHVVVVTFENHAYSQISGSSSAPYFNSLASQGAKFTNSFAITHPSQPNYLALFSCSPSTCS